MSLRVASLSTKVELCALQYTRYIDQYSWKESESYQVVVAQEVIG